MAYVSRVAQSGVLFPANNLPSDSKLWGLEVEKRIANLQADFQSAEVNNITRDTQLTTSYTRLDAAVTKINSILEDLGVLNDNVFGPGGLEESIANVTDVVIDPIDNTKINGLNLKAGTVLADNVVSSYVYAGSIAASQITAGTLTGFTIQTAAGGTRAKLSGSNIEFFSGLYGGGGSRVGYIQGDDGGDAGLYIISDQGEIALDSVSITLAGDTTVSNSLYVNGDFGIGGSFNPGSISSSGSVSAASGFSTSSSSYLGYISCSSVDANSLSATGNISSSAGTVSAGFNVTAGNNIYASGSNGCAGNLYGGTIQRPGLSGGGTTGASITDGGFLVRTSSSQRYKEQIEDLNIAYESILGLKPKKFKRKDEVESRGDDARYYPGFIAEDLAGTDLDIFAFYETLEDGTKRPDGIHYPELTAALVLALKHQDQLIKDLTARVEALEG
jgi:hypothetical protein